LDAKGAKPYEVDEDNQIMEDGRENKWLSNTGEASASNFMEFAGLHESGPAFGNAASLHAHTRSDADAMITARNRIPLTPLTK
jgi:hypothetical protein